jgi:dipeptidase E
MEWPVQLESELSTFGEIFQIMKKLLVASTSTVHGSSYLEYAEPLITDHFQGLINILFVPFARPGGISHDEYTSLAARVFEKLGFKMRGAHEFGTSKEAIEWSDGIFTGGGNTFVLLSQLYERGFIALIKDAVESGKPYMGTSAGSNILGISIRTTNDMPIQYPPSFDCLGLLPFNINPHYLDPDPSSKHMGETRETRIKEFHEFNSQRVVGLREGSCLIVSGTDVSLSGPHSMRIFEPGRDAYELSAGDDLSFLITN